MLVTTNGTGSPQSRIISAYIGRCHQNATVSEDFTVLPTAGTEFMITPGSNVLSGPAWQTLITMVSNPAAGTSSVSGFLCGREPHVQRGTGQVAH
jgi:hypothetical protein